MQDCRGRGGSTALLGTSGHLEDSNSLAGGELDTSGSFSAPPPALLLSLKSVFLASPTHLLSHSQAPGLGARPAAPYPAV